MSTPIPAAISGPAAIAAAFPHVWRASQMASYWTAAIPTGHQPLDRELPDDGWPAGTLIELLPQQPGIGEMLLLQPTLRRLAQHRRIALVQPPHPPQITV